jgi:non-homologous end joining protein Ku
MAANMGRPKNPLKPKKLMKEVLPVDQIFKPDELELYNSLIDIYLADFDQSDLTSADMDDIMSMAINKVLEIQLLKSAKDNTNKKMDISSAMEKIRRQTEKMKENLSSRRRDRIDPNKYKGFSIVNLAVAFDNDKKEQLLKKQT